MSGSFYRLDADHLATPQLERCRFDPATAAHSLDVDRGCPHNRFSRRCWRWFRQISNALREDRARELLLGARLCIPNVGHSTAAKHRDVVGNGERLAELVCYEHDASASRCKVANPALPIVDLRRCKHGRWLI